MRVAVFSTKPYDRTFLERANGGFGHELTFFEPRLTSETSSLADRFPAVCVFVNDILDAPVLERLAETYFFLSTKLYGISWMVRPIVMLLFLLILATLVHAVLRERKRSRVKSPV